MTHDPKLVEAMAAAIWETADDEVGWAATLSLAASPYAPTAKGGGDA